MLLFFVIPYLAFAVNHLQHSQKFGNIFLVKLNLGKITDIVDTNHVAMTEKDQCKTIRSGVIHGSSFLQKPY
jgi:hypothetical protein